MSATKRFLEFVSNAKGYDGEVNDDVCIAAEQITSSLSSARPGEYAKQMLADFHVSEAAREAGEVMVDANE